MKKANEEFLEKHKEHLEKMREELREEVEKQAKNFEDAAFPVVFNVTNASGRCEVSIRGLTKREYIAAQILAAYTANGKTPSRYIGEAVESADALLERLSK